MGQIIPVKFKAPGAPDAGCRSPGGRTPFVGSVGLQSGILAGSGLGFCRSLAGGRWRVSIVLGAVPKDWTNPWTQFGQATHSAVPDGTIAGAHGLLQNRYRAQVKKFRQMSQGVGPVDRFFPAGSFLDQETLAGTVTATPERYRRPQSNGNRLFGVLVNRR